MARIGCYELLAAGTTKLFFYWARGFKQSVGKEQVTVVLLQRHLIAE
jgi:hypothetical protein